MKGFGEDLLLRASARAKIFFSSFVWQQIKVLNASYNLERNFQTADSAKPKEAKMPWQ